MRIQNNVYHGVQEEDQSQIVPIFYISATRSYRTSGSFNLFHNTSFYHSLYLTNMQKKCAMNYLKQYKICQEPGQEEAAQKMWESTWYSSNQNTNSEGGTPMQTSEGEPMPILEGDSHNKSSWTNPTTPVVQPSYLHYINYLPEVMKGD